MCGDHLLYSQIKNLGKGSPPHVRGPQYLLANYPPSAGSPPHVRGPHKHIEELVEIEGITPACAGTTDTKEIIKGGTGDHPRMCGDHKQWQQYLRSMMGSPPHVRGPLLLVFLGIVLAGITPACAGTTLHMLLLYLC